ncbi:MAG TPA: DUF4339 domain-containing protein, partial [Terriglobia bacterium]|nr:DUF4339 domain-containing protein [Terriglobia bacterium]
MSMYKILGTDGKEYGPADVDQIRRWMAEGRINRETLLRREGESSWIPLSNIPELAATAMGPPAYLPGSMSAADQVNAPAIALMVTAAVGFALQVIGIVANMAG